MANFTTLVMQFTTGNFSNSTGNSTNATCGLSLVPAGSEDTFTYIALAAVVVSSLSTTFGLFWQKAAQEYFSKAKHASNKPKKAKKLKCKGTGLWVLGFSGITIVSFGLDLFAMSVLGQSVVVPLLASLEIAENQIFAPCMVHEVCVKKYDITATVFIIVGAVLTTVFGPPGQEICSIEAIQDLFAKIPFLVFEGIVLAILVFCLSLMWSKAKCVDKFRFMLFAFVAGALGGEQNLFLKGIGVLIGFAFAGENTFGEWQIWVFLLCMVTLAVLQLVILNMGLARFEALQFVPAFTVLYILMGTMVGLIFYEEYVEMTELSWGMFCLGISFIIVALVILGQKKSHETDTHPTEVDEDGNPILIRKKSFTPMLVSGSALEHLKHLAKPLHNRIMLLRAFRRAHSMTSIAHTAGPYGNRVAPEGAIELVELQRKSKRGLRRSFSVDDLARSASVSAAEVAAAKGDVNTARRKSELKKIMSSSSPTGTPKAKLPEQQKKSDGNHGRSTSHDPTATTRRGPHNNEPRPRALTETKVALASRHRHTNSLEGKWETKKNCKTLAPLESKPTGHGHGHTHGREAKETKVNAVPLAKRADMNATI